jgi:hypothetical protein
MSFQDHVAMPGDSNLNIRPTQTEGVYDVSFTAPDSRKNVKFYNKKVSDPDLSAQYGRPMFKEEPYVFIQEPGERDYIDDPLRNKPWAPTRFPRQWAQYQKQQEQIPEGTPIDFLFPQHPYIGENLRSMSIHTIEQMAGMHDTGLQNIGMGAFQWRDKAKNYLAMANKGVGAHKLQTELDARDNTIATMKSQMDEMRTRIDRLTAQVDQKIPATMIPSTPAATQAQAHAGTVELRQDWTTTQPKFQGADFSQHLYSDASPPIGPMAGGGTDWTQEAVDADHGDDGMGVSGADRPYDAPAINSIVPNDPPRAPARGWPKGKPRGPRIPSQ